MKIVPKIFLKIPEKISVTHPNAYFARNKTEQNSKFVQFEGQIVPEKVGQCGLFIVLSDVARGEAPPWKLVLGLFLNVVQQSRQS